MEMQEGTGYYGVHTHLVDEIVDQLVVPSSDEGTAVGKAVLTLTYLH